MDLGVWRLEQGQPARRVPASVMPSEQRLETLIAEDPAVLGEPLLLVGRQVTTWQGKRIDLLAMDADGGLHVIEVKRDKAPRDVLAQALEYAAWVQGLHHDDVRTIHDTFRPGVALEESFVNVFGDAPFPEEINTGHKVILVASDIPTDTQKVVEYLRGFGIPVTVMLIRYFTDEGHEYVARTWLIEEAPGEELKGRSAAGQGSREPWNGIDWYVSFGEGDDGCRSWEDARAEGFVCAGGGDWYSRTLKAVPTGARVWAYIPKTGYVGVGTTSGPADPFPDSGLDKDALDGTYTHENGEEEWVVPVRWHTTVPEDQAVFQAGMFASGNSATRLRSRFTLERLYDAFGVPEDE